MVADSLISGTDLYITGTNDATGASEACYWLVDLTTGTHSQVPLPGGSDGNAFEITYSGSTIYIAGTLQDKPYYWTITGGSVDQHLVYNSTINNARTVMLNGGNIIIGGWFDYDATHTQAWYCTFTTPPVSVLDELPYKMSDISNSSIVSSSLNVSGNRYIVGQRPVANSPTASGTACYWLNGTTGYNLISSGISFANEIAQTAAGDVFITGYDDATDASGTSSTACVWKREGSIFTQIELAPTSATGEAAARDVFVKD